MPGIVIAHRGAGASHPENTLAAFRSALSPRVAADGVELDVRLSADGVPVVFHDETADRMCGEPGRISDMTLDELRGLDVEGEPIPTLAEVVDVFRGMRSNAAFATFHVELKTTPEPDRLVGACVPILEPLTTARQSPLVVSSFDPRVLATVRALGLSWRSAYIYRELDALSALRYLGEVDLHPSHTLVDGEHLLEYGCPERLFRCWTVDEPKEAARLLDLGVAAIITNRPGHIRRRKN